MTQKVPDCQFFYKKFLVLKKKDTDYDSKAHALSISSEKKDYICTSNIYQIEKNSKIIENTLALGGMSPIIYGGDHKQPYRVHI